MLSSQFSIYYFYLILKILIIIIDRYILSNYKQIISELALSQSMINRQKGKKRAVGAQLERMLLYPIPQTPIPQPYFNIPAPENFRFPLSETMLEGIQLLQNYFPDDINEKIKKKIGHRIQRMSRYRDTYCMVGKDGNGLLIGDRLKDIKGISAYAYGPNYLVVAYKDLTLQVYDMNMVLIKALKKFSRHKITFIKILNTPKTYENIILMCNQGNKVTIYRLQKSFFSTLSCKLQQDIIVGLDFPVTQMAQIPQMFKLYLRKDAGYKDTSLICVSAIKKIFIIRINHFRLNMEKFWDTVYTKQWEQPTTNSVSWGQATVNAPSLDIKGDKLILTYSFGQYLYFLAFRQVQRYLDGEIITKCQWIESKPFVLKEGRVAFCQYMKKSQILIVTQDNTVIIFHTKNFQIFEKEISSDEIEAMIEKHDENLQARTVQNIQGKLPQHIDPKAYSQQDIKLLREIPLVTFADCFSYQYPSNQIYFLTQQKFGVYAYCNWKIITNLLKVEQRYECAMLFLIAMSKKANRFDLGISESEKQLSQYIQMLATEYINNKIAKIKNYPDIIKNITSNPQFFKVIITPIQFLTQTGEFTFLFEIAKDKIISALAVTPTENDFLVAERVFFKALEKFIEHGRIKQIPESQMQYILQYFVTNDRQGMMLDRLAIFFDLNRINVSIVVQILLRQELVVSLAHICIQGNESLFITPFVKFWGISESHRMKGQKAEAQIYAFRALWYVKLCLQRNWALKEYSFDQYSKMITVLSQYFLTQRILKGLFQIRASYCLQVLSFYFTIQNATIINQTKLNLDSIQIPDWIDRKEGNEQLQIVLSAIAKFIGAVQRGKWETPFNLFLSGIIVYKTVKFRQQKYYQILIKLIQEYQTTKQVRFGLQQKRYQQFMEKHQDYHYPEEDIQSVLAARFIVRTFTLIFYEAYDYIKPRINEIYEKSRVYNLTDLQAELSFVMGNYRNSIDIYARAKPYPKSLVFQFLENSFKKLVLQRKKQQKKLLAKCITQEIKWMVGLDPKKTKNLIDVYIPEIQEQLIDALSDDQRLQLEYLEDIINDQGYNQRKRKLSDRAIARFVQLMAKLKPNSLIDVFKKNTYLSMEDNLKTCEQYKVYDCMEYLYERMGSISESVKISALRIDQILQNRDTFDEQDAPYIKIKDILDNAIAVCKRNHSQQVWQALLDSSISLYEKYRQLNMPQDQIQIFFFINGEIMEHLASNCPLQHTIYLLQDKYKNLNMGGKMTKAFTNILSNLSHSINILYISSNLVQSTLHTLLEKDYEARLSCYSTTSDCVACGYSLNRRKISVHFKCGHSFHQDCVVHSDQANEPTICVACLLVKTQQFNYYLNTLNPQYPKRTKIISLIEKFKSKKLQMTEIFRIEEYETIEKKEENLMEKRVEKKHKKFAVFDEGLQDIQQGNRRVLEDLNF